MKKLFALLLCCVLLAALFVGCGSEDSITPPFLTPSDLETAAPETTAAADASAASEEAAPVQDGGINFKGLSTGTVTLEDVKKAEGREPDLEFAVGEVPYYAYNNVTLDDMTFAQVQFSFNEGNVRISCTATAEDGLDGLIAAWNTSVSARYGAPSENNGTYHWSDGTGNYIMLSALNETTVQLAFYLYKA